jgi:predicted ATPase
LLNTTRCYAREQLERSGEGIELERRHMRYINRTRQASDVQVLA